MWIIFFSLSLGGITLISAFSECDPQTPATFRGNVPTPKEILGIDLGERQVTVEESDMLLATITDASDRVINGTLARSVEGRPLNYAIVSNPENLREETLNTIRLNNQKLRDPNLSSEDAFLIASETPAIVWILGSVHGNEPSGCDAALHLLYDLSDRNDCAAEQILENTVIIILPTQNPDGRVANGRRNANGFDLNRDWFARTQPEVDGKVAKMMEYIPVLSIDAHEMGGTSYYFPPTKDPYFHDLSTTPVDWIDNLYGAAMAVEFNRQGIPFFHEAFDFYYMGKGSTFPTVLFGAAGMTFEKGGSSLYPLKEYEQFLAQWVSVSETAINRQAILVTLHSSFVRARDQGAAGVLQPNVVYHSGHEVERKVPDIKIRVYYLLANDTMKKIELLKVIHRLQNFGVIVEELTAGVLDDKFVAYGRRPSETYLTAGTYCISMAQQQKHLIQALLGEDPYVPFPLFNDLTGWSSPLLENIPGGYSEQRLSSSARVISPLSLSKNSSVLLLSRVPTIAVLQPSASSPGESFDWLCFTLKSWNVEFTKILPSDIEIQISNFELLLVPHVSSVTSVYNALGKSGVVSLGTWVDTGGHYVGYGGGAVLAGLCGLSTARFQSSTSDCSGALFRINFPDFSHPLATGVGSEAYLYYRSSFSVIQAASAHIVAMFPESISDDWFVSGYQEGAEELGGSAAVTQEHIGEGIVVLMVSELNYRAFTGGSAKILANAITAVSSFSLKSIHSQLRTQESFTHSKIFQVRESIESARIFMLQQSIRPVRISVRGSEVNSVTEDRIISVLHSFGQGEKNWVIHRSVGRIAFDVENPFGFDWDEHPWAAQVQSSLQKSGVKKGIVYILQ